MREKESAIPTVGDRNARHAVTREYAAQIADAVDQSGGRSARALATEPEVICLDEVMGSRKPAEIVGAMALIRSIHDSGVTVLMIEHHVHAVVGLSNRIMVLNFGQKIAEGPPQQVMRDPAVIAAYLGDDAAPLEALK